jgi:hypothetical protein
MALPEAMPNSEAAFPLALAYRALGQEEESRKWYQIGVTELDNVRPRNPDDPAPWAHVHWLNVNVWYREAKTVLGSTEKPAAKGGSAASSVVPVQGTEKRSDKQNPK